MTKGELMKALKADKHPDSTEIMIQERACENTHSLDSISCGWYIDDEMDNSSVIDESENPKDYDIDPKSPKVIVLE